MCEFGRCRSRPGIKDQTCRLSPFSHRGRLADEMACRPKDESYQDEPAHSSKIFKSLRESESSKSFRMTAPSASASPKSQTNNSTLEDGEQLQPRSVRASEAIRLRESLDQSRMTSANKQPRAPTSEDAQKMNARFDSDERDDDDGSCEVEKKSARSERNKTLAHRSALIAQLETNSSKPTQSPESGRRSINPQINLHARFKSSSQGSHLGGQEFDLDDSVDLETQKQRQDSSSSDETKER